MLFLGSHVEVFPFPLVLWASQQALDNAMGRWFPHSGLDVSLSCCLVAMEKQNSRLILPFNHSVVKIMTWFPINIEGN